MRRIYQYDSNAWWGNNTDIGIKFDKVEMNSSQFNRYSPNVPAFSCNISTYRTENISTAYTGLNDTLTTQYFRGTDISYNPLFITMINPTTGQEEDIRNDNLLTDTRPVYNIDGVNVYAVQFVEKETTFTGERKPFLRIKIGEHHYLCASGSVTYRGNYYDIKMGWNLTTNNDNTIDLMRDSRTDDKNYVLTSVTITQGNPIEIGGFRLYEFTYQDDTYLVFTYTYKHATTDYIQTFTSGAINVSKLERDIGAIGYVETNEPTNNTFPPSSVEDGYVADGDHTSDTIPIPPQPSISISQIGLINVYHPSIDGLQGFVNDLFPDIDFPTFNTSGDITDIVENIGKVGESIVKGIRMTMNEKLLDYVLDVHLLPVSPIDETIEPIQVGYTSSSVSAPKTLTDYIDFNCGTINIKETYGNFIDYQCTQIKLYLPFVGYVPIKSEYILNGALSVVYRFNVLDGSFVCFILSTSSKSQLTDSVIGTYSGNCCVHIPISATSFSNVISGVVGGVSNMEQSIKTNSASSFASGALETITSKPNLMLNNGYNATSSYLGIRQPYLIIERAVPSYPTSYNDSKGLPSNVTKKLSNCSGYVSCDISNVTIDNVLCDDIDKEEIKTLLNDYIIL